MKKVLLMKKSPLGTSLSIIRMCSRKRRYFMTGADKQQIFFMMLVMEYENLNIEIYIYELFRNLTAMPFPSLFRRTSQMISP